MVLRLLAELYLRMVEGARRTKPTWHGGHWRPTVGLPLHLLLNSVAQFVGGHGIGGMSTCPMIGSGGRPLIAFVIFLPLRTFVGAPPEGPHRCSVLDGASCPSNVVCGWVVLNLLRIVVHDKRLGQRSFPLLLFQRIIP
jgi:hypothetical protein